MMHTFRSKIAWNAYFFDTGDEVVNWEIRKENGDPKAISSLFWHESTSPILIMITWIICAGWVCLFIYPILSMLVFRLLFLVWNFATNG
jgi:hypothetical protein